MTACGLVALYVILSTKYLLQANAGSEAFWDTSWESVRSETFAVRYNPVDLLAYIITCRGMNVNILLLLRLSNRAKWNPSRISGGCYDILILFSFQMEQIELRSFAISASIPKALELYLLLHVSFFRPQVAGVEGVSCYNDALLWSKL